MSSAPDGSRPSSFLGSQASSLALFLSGAALLPAFLFQQDLVIRSALFLLFMGLNVASGRRPRLLQYVLVGAGIVVFNLVIPTGRVLVSFLGLPITEVALKTGVSKATAMVGLIALSLFSIRSDLRLPGRFGGLLGRSLLYFEAIMSERRVIDRADIIGSIDTILLSLGDAARSPAAAGDSPSAGDSPPAGDSPSAPDRQRFPGLAALVILVAANWGLFAFTLIHPRLFWGG